MEKQDDSKKHLRHRSHNENEKKAVVPGHRHTKARSRKHTNTMNRTAQQSSTHAAAHTQERSRTPNRPLDASKKTNDQRCPEVGSEIPKRTSGHQERQGVQRSIQESSRPARSTLHRTRCKFHWFSLRFKHIENFEAISTHRPLTGQPPEALFQNSPKNFDVFLAWFY